MNEHEALIQRAVADKSTVALIGGLDSGKTTLARSMALAALAAGRHPAFLDADLGQKSVGPPTTIGMKLIRVEGDLEAERLAQADAC